MGYTSDKTNRPIGMIIDAVHSQIIEKAEKATEQIRPTIHRETGALQESLHVEKTKWGAKVVMGDPARPEVAPNYEFGNRGQNAGHLSGGYRPLLKIRQLIERS
jgi:hypothetical protein